MKYELRIMDYIFKNTIKFFLKWLAKIYLWRIRPYVIIVAGTTNRHWTKEAIIEALKEKGLTNVRGNRKNFNAEIGLPLSILDLPSGEGSFGSWFKIILQAIKKTTYYKLLTTNYLVLEMAIDRPENMDYLLNIVKPNIVVLTTITMIYRENFEDLSEIALEYRKLVKALPKDGLLLLNFDDQRIKDMARFASCRALTYGLNEGADYQAKNIRKIITGQQFDVVEANKQKHSRAEINRFGNHHIYAKITAYAIRSEKF